MVDVTGLASTEFGIPHSPLFVGRTGRGIRIAVIDSGVHPDHPHIHVDRLDAGIMVLADGTIEIGQDATLDRLGHGTAVAAAIQEKAPDARLIPIRVFRDALKTSAAALVSAIRWAVAQQVDIINLSLGSMNAAHRDAFAAVADEAAEHGVVLVAAREANDMPCYPGALTGVIGVQLDWDCPRESYRAATDSDTLVFLASGYPRPIPGVPQQRNLYGISFAVAQVSGFTALACEPMRTGVDGHGRLHALQQALVAETKA